MFGERLPHTWFCGATLVVAGVMLMVVSTDTITEGTSGIQTGDDADEKKRHMDYSPPKTHSKRD